MAGGSGGIGSAVCRALAADGHDVALSYLSNVEAASATAAAAQSVGASTVSTQVDLTDPAAVHRWVSDIADSLGRIDVVIYAAGPYVPMRYISAVTPEEFRRQLLADTCAFYNVVSPALAHLRHHGGAIVAVSTPATRRWAARDLLSAAPKASIEAVVRGIAAEEGKYGVRANCVGVGLLRDGLFHDLLEREATTRTPMSHWPNGSSHCVGWGGHPRWLRRWRSWRVPELWPDPDGRRGVCAMTTPMSSDARRREWLRPGAHCVRPGVHRIPLSLPEDGLQAVNVYAVEDGDRIVLVDTGQDHPTSNRELSDGLAGASVDDISHVLSTHVHYDHYTGRGTDTTPVCGHGRPRSQRGADAVDRNGRPHVADRDVVAAAVIC